MEKRLAKRGVEIPHKGCSVTLKRQRKLSRDSDDRQRKPAFWTMTIVVYCEQMPVLSRQGYSKDMN